jgi:hypothetical protein
MRRMVPNQTNVFILAEPVEDDQHHKAQSASREAFERSGFGAPDQQK